MQIKLNLVILLILVAGLVTSLILVRQPQVFSPKAITTTPYTQSSYSTGTGGTQTLTVTVSSCVGTSRHVNLSWNALSGVSSATLVRKTASGAQTSIGISYPSLSAVDSSVTPGSYTYVLTAYMATGADKVATKTVTVGTCSSGYSQASYASGGYSQSSYSGPSSCTLSGPTTLSAGTSGTFTNSLNCASPNVCITGVYDGPTGFTPFAQQGGSLQFTPTIAGSYKVYSNFYINGSPTIRCEKPITVTGSASYTQSTYYSQSSYAGTYSQSTYYTQASYTGGYTQASYTVGYSQASYSGGYTQSTYYSQSSYGGGYTQASYAVVTSRPTPTPQRLTAEYRIAESTVDLANAAWQPYSSNPVSIYHTFATDNFGVKQLCAQFKASDGTISTPNCELVELIDPPVITGCNLNITGSYVEYEVMGKNFGVQTGTVAGGLQITSWTNEKMVLRNSNPPTGTVFTINFEDSNHLKATGQCSAVSQVAVGARLFCPQVKPADIPGVIISIKNLSKPSPIIKETVMLSKEGVVLGLKTKLEEGAKYVLAIEVPKSIRKTAEFTAVRDTTNVDLTKGGQVRLPLGDIFPLAGGDGSINSLDKSQLNRDWVISVAGKDRAADLNVDGRVNSFDWACMKQDFGASDDNF
jgi:hypothetical protein